MTELTKEAYIAAVRNNSSRLADVAAQSLTAPVPTCPGWIVAALVAHLGEVQRFWAHQVRNRASETLNLPEAELTQLDGLMPFFDTMDAGVPDPALIPNGLLDWFRSSTAGLVDAFSHVDPAEAVWHWSGDNRAITHMRNQAMEATVHRVDTELAANELSSIDEGIAVDGIAQHFEVQLPASRSETTPRGNGESYHFHRTDGDGEWYIRFQDETYELLAEHRKADVAIRGSGVNLFLWLWSRGGIENLDIVGDHSLVARYKELVPGM